jgi:hypothetical protein
MEAIYEFIFKLTSAYPHILLWFNQNQEKWKFLINWAQQIHFPLTDGA